MALLNRQLGEKWISQWRILAISTVLLIMVVYLVRAQMPPPDQGTGSYEDLVTLFREWRDFQKPKLIDGIPDYTPSAMAKQYDQLAEYQRRLAVFDISHWPVPHQVDYHLVRAEMNGMDFDHRVRKPWAHMPAFYTMVWPSQSDVPAREGPVLYGTIELWQYNFPLNMGDAAELAAKLRTIPKVLEQAKGNLIGNARDLWIGGIRAMKGQSRDLNSLAQRIDAGQTNLLSAIQEAQKATDDFISWLESEAPSKTGPSGVGKENYNWYLKNVYLLPHTWEEEVTIMRSELARARATLKLEEHHNRKLPPLSAIASAEEYSRQSNAAVTQFIKFLKEEEIVTVKDYMEPALRRQISSFIPPDQYRHFFAKISHHDPIVMLTHQYHWIELARMANEPHPDPIRRVPLLYNIFVFRAEGLATAVEEMFMHAGLLDGRPRSRELIWILVANRAARALAGLYAQSNDFTLEQAVDFACKWTPRGWLEKDGDLVWFEQDLYLMQPGYGSSYLTGKLQIEKLLTERARQLGENFTLKGFMDEINATGIIPPSLIRWELTGKDDELNLVWDYH